MTGTRRYNDQEIAEILERATSERGGRPALPKEAGLTLGELEQIGAEVGIQPERIAEAVQSMERADRVPKPERFLGAPRSVARTLQIERALNDEEWARVVADLRRTFNAKGKVEIHGSLRSWSNSSLQVHVEPEGTSYAVRMRTRKGNATQFTLMGVAFSAMGVAAGLEALTGTGSDSLVGAALLTSFGVGLIAWVRATLPGWARTRAEQMEGLAERITLMLRD